MKFTARDRLRSHLLRTEGCQAIPNDFQLRDTVKARSVDDVPVVPRTDKVMPKAVVPDEAGSIRVNNTADQPFLPTNPVCFANS